MNAKIYSINISAKKKIPKASIDSAEVIENFGLKGDAHAGDATRQVSLLAIESINRQAESVKVPGGAHELKAGDFAENITTMGIELSKLKIGDRLKLGGSVILEISRIGKECHERCEVYYRTGACIMPREGMFAKVLKGGRIVTGDPIGVE